MKNIHVIQTDKPSNIAISTIDGKLKLNNSTNDNAEYHGKNQHIYITSDEEIKEGDWVLKFPFNELVFKALEVKKDEFVQEKRLCNYPYNWCKKIILTTDQDLIAEGIQQIDDEFLEWFVKNPSYEYVLITNDFEQVNQDNPVLKGSTNLVLKYKITMLGEKSNKQETLGEVTERLFKSYSNPTALSEGHYDYMMDRDDFKEAVKELFSYQQQTNLHT